VGVNLTIRAGEIPRCEMGTQRQPAKAPSPRCCRPPLHTLPLVRSATAARICWSSIPSSGPGSVCFLGFPVIPLRFWRTAHLEFLRLATNARRSELAKETLDPFALKILVP